MLPTERDVPLEQARENILAELSSNGLRFEQYDYGHTVRAIITKLFDDKNNFVTQGAGKGYLERAGVGSLFEAFEHYVTDEHTLLDTIELTAVDDLLGLSCAPQLHDIFSGQKGAYIGCRAYEVSSGGHSLFPVALSVPRYADQPKDGDTFDYSALRRYASNSGTAAGSNSFEAELHALNERIERHDLSLFLAHFFFQEKGGDLKVVDFTTFPDHILRLLRDVERETGLPIVVLDITSSNLANTYLAFGRERALLPLLFGCGTSLSAPHAVERALTELAQLHLVQRHISDVNKDRIAAMKNLAALPSLSRTLMCNLSGLVDSCDLVSVALPQETSSYGSCRQQCDELRRRMHAQGLVCLKTSLWESGHVSVVHVVVPAFDNFYLVTSGNIVVPNSCYELTNA